MQTGGIGRVCPQARPAWGNTASLVVSRAIAGKPIDASKIAADSASSGSSSGAATILRQDPRATEDCLFLDLLVPRPVFEAAQAQAQAQPMPAAGTEEETASATTKTPGVPVLVWIYGGGYTAGDKQAWPDSASPAGLLRRANDSIIYVAFNYRLGAFGFLAGPTLQANGTANAGLLDQRFALQWVQSYIHLFGGDPKRVTVMGESAGGGSIMHQITVSTLFLHPRRSRECLGV